MFDEKGMGYVPDAVLNPPEAHQIDEDRQKAKGVSGEWASTEGETVVMPATPGETSPADVGTEVPEPMHAKPVEQPMVQPSEDQEDEAVAA